MTNFVPLALRVSTAAAAAIVLAGCSMGSMLGGGGAAQTQTLQNATATPAAVAQAQTSALPNFFGGKKRIKNFVQMLDFYTFACIANGANYGLISAMLLLFFAVLRRRWP